MTNHEDRQHTPTTPYEVLAAEAEQILDGADKHVRNCIQCVTDALADLRQARAERQAARDLLNHYREMLNR